MRSKSLGVRALALAVLSASANTSLAVDDGKGRDWRQVVETRGLTRAQVGAVCAVDGLTPCAGAINGIEFDEWTWASQEQLLDLFSNYVPEILTAPNMQASVFGAPATLFQSQFALTMRNTGCVNYSCFDFRQVAGHTATVNSYGQGTGGDVNLAEGAATFTVGTVAANDPSPRGHWMWRPTGLLDGTVHAYKDKGRSTSPLGGVAIANVLANDYAAGAPATVQNVSLQQISAAIPGVTLDLADGSVDVASGTAIGTYTLVYQICSLADPAQCDTAPAAVTVPSFSIVANPDTAIAAFGVGGTPIANVLANDTLGGVRATLAIVTLAQVSSTHTGVSLDATTGAVRVAPGTANGPHALIYRICEMANPNNCAQATVTLAPSYIDAVNDYFRMSSKVASSSPSVLNNDYFGSGRPTTVQVSLRLLSAAPYGVSFNTSTGVFSTKGKVSSGAFSVSYQICEIGNPGNCDSATVTLDLSGKGS